MIEQDFRAASGQSNFTIADKNTTQSRYGLINSKVRKMIVVECYADHYVAVALFTHNGKGLSRKKKPEEYIRSVTLNRTSPRFLGHKACPRSKEIRLQAELLDRDAD